MARVTIRVVGPMKRSALDRESTDPIDRSFNDILHWSWSTRLQVDRLKRSLAEEIAAWGRGQRVRARRAFSASSYDEHQVLVAARNLLRAFERAARPLRPVAALPEHHAKALHLLRDVYEHWEQSRRQLAGAAPLTKAAEKLKSAYPGAEPWSLTYDPRTGAVVLCALVDLESLVPELRSLEARLHRARRAGVLSSNQTRASNKPAG